MACVRYRRGRWVIDFYDQEGKRRWETLPKGTDRKGANEKLGEMERKVRQGAYVPLKSLPVFSDLADSWLSSKQPDLRHTTHENYTGHVENYLKPFFGKLKLNQITYDTIDTFKTKALRGELPAECLKGKVKPSTLRNILRTLHGMMKYAVKRRYIDHNPVAEVEKPKGKSEHDETKEMRILTLPEIKVFLEKAANQRDRVLFMAAILTGLREGELFGLKWGDVDWLNCQFHVRRTYNHGRFYEPKSKTSRRRVDLAPELVQELKRWKLACPKGEHDLVFPTQLGTPESHSNMTKYRFKPTLRRAGLAEIRFHDLRHTYASLLIEQNEHPKYIQNQMGHSSSKITMDVYGHLMKDVNRESASKLGRLVFGDSSKTVATEGVGN